MKRTLSFATTLRDHFPEYLCEAAELGLFMLSACLFGALLEHSASPLRHAIDGAFARRALMGLAMAATAVAIVYSPLGKRSGAHFNPAVTLTFVRLGKVAPHDGLAYVAAQFAGGIAGVTLASLLADHALADPGVRYVATLPGPSGVTAAFSTELGMAFVLMTVVLEVSNRPRVARFTGLAAATLVASYITFLAPLSGMSMNPARTSASALFARVWTDAWIYFAAPALGMLAAAQVYVARKGPAHVHCAKLHHDNSARCIFCEYGVTRIRDEHPTFDDAPGGIEGVPAAVAGKSARV